MKLVAACAFGLEAPVKWELQQLGYSARPTRPGRVEFEGSWKDVVTCNLWLRVADRILIEVDRFAAPDFDTLFETLKSMCWKDWLPESAKFPVNARSRNSQLTSIPAIQRSSKKAIVESLAGSYRLDTLPEDGPVYPIDAAFLDDVVSVTIDTTGASLHKRGYRRSSGEAPVKETLAAAMVMLSVWNPERPLIDPFCGSGTIPIEAAMIGRNMPPGSSRKFNWHDWPQIEKKIADDVYEQALSMIDNDVQLQISGTDINREVLRHARVNAENAGVADDIHFQEKAFADLRSKRQYGCVITNPPYGERLNERRQLLPLYKSIPGVLQRLPTWSHFILTSIPGFEGLIQKSATRRRKLFNGRIECMYYQFLGPKPQLVESGAQVKPAAAVDKRDAAPISGQDESASAPVFGGLHDKDRQQGELFGSRLKKRARHLRRWPARRGVTCYRIYDRDIPELPFVVDRYEDYFHVTEYERPHERDPGRHAGWLELMKKTVAATFDVPIQHVYLKSRRRQSGAIQHGRLASTGRKIIVQEGGLKFLVNLSDYVDTGLFLDHRITRRMVREDAAGKNVLNLFAYTGSFAVYAAAGGALSTTNVDWSNAYLDWAQENMQLNDFTGSRHQFVRQDAMDFVATGESTPGFDLVVVDPPTFSNSKRTDRIWDIQKNYIELLNRLASLVRSGAIVYFSTNSRKFKFEMSELIGYEGRDISAQTVPEDFRNRRIHRCWKLRRV